MITTALTVKADPRVARSLAFIEALQLPDGMTLRERFESDPWLRDSLFLPALMRGRDGLPEHKYCWLELPKGSLKTTALAALALTEGLLESRTEIYILAVDSDQGRLSLQALSSFISHSPRLTQLVRQTHSLFTLPGGSFIKVMASDSASFHGVGVAARRLRFLCDEVTQWPSDSMWSAAVASLPKARDSQLVACTNAGISGSWVEGAKDQLRRAGAHMFISVAGWLPSWLSRSDVDALRLTLPEALWRRYYENQWVQELGSFVGVEQWDRCLGTVPPYAGEELIGGVDAGLRRDSFGITFVSRHPENHEYGVMIRDVRVWTPTSKEINFADPFDWLLEYVNTHNIVQLAFDEWQLSDFMRRFRDASGAWCRSFSQGPDRAKADTLLLELIRSRRLLHSGDEELREHIGNASFRISAGAEERGRLVKGRGPIDLAVSLSMCASECLRLNL